MSKLIRKAKSRYLVQEINVHGSIHLRLLDKEECRDLNEKFARHFHKMNLVQLAYYALIFRPCDWGDGLVNIDKYMLGNAVASCTGIAAIRQIVDTIFLLPTFVVLITIALIILVYFMRTPIVQFLLEVA